MYQEVVLDHYKYPRNYGLREGHETRIVNPNCGDELTIRVAIRDLSVSDLSWETDGCAISRASTSVLSEEVTGLKLDAATELVGAFIAAIRSRTRCGEDQFGDWAAFSDVYPARIGCALLPAHAFQKFYKTMKEN